MKKLIFTALLSIPLHCLELERVILATDENPMYIDFWPIVAPLWKAMGFKPTLALVANAGCNVDTSLGDVIRFEPIQGIPTSLQAQVIRLFLPSFFPDEGCILSDIDMLPISASYFFEGAKDCPDNAFLAYRDRAPGYFGVKYPMCYVAAKGRIFRSIFNVSNKEEIVQQIRHFSHRGLGWNTDELLMYEYVQRWKKGGGQVVALGHTVGPRLDRIHWRYDFDHLDLANYIDCHCPRPYLEHKDSIDKVVQAIQWKINQKKLEEGSL